MESRGLKLLRMAKENARLAYLDIPYYERTSGTEQSQQKVLIEEGKSKTFSFFEDLKKLQNNEKSTSDSIIVLDGYPENKEQHQKCSIRKNRICNVPLDSEEMQTDDIEIHSSENATGTLTAEDILHAEFIIDRSEIPTSDSLAHNGDAPLDSKNTMETDDIGKDMSENPTFSAQDIIRPNEELMIDDSEHGSESDEYIEDSDADPLYSPHQSDQSSESSAIHTDNDHSSPPLTNELLKVADEAEAILLNGNSPFQEIFEALEEEESEAGNGNSEQATPCTLSHLVRGKKGDEGNFKECNASRCKDSASVSKSSNNEAYFSVTTISQDNIVKPRISEARRPTSEGKVCSISKQNLPELVEGNASRPKNSDSHANNEPHVNEPVFNQNKPSVSEASRSTVESQVGSIICQNVPELVVGRSTVSNKRIWDKRDFCIFCLQLVTNFTRHIIRNHEDEIEVGKCLANPKGSRERRFLFEQLRKKGNFFHNKNCIREKTGKIIVKQRPKTNNPVTNYLPCKQCLGFYSKKSLYRHMQKCKLNTSSDCSKNAQGFGAMLLVVTPEGFENLKAKIFPIMRNDNISKAAQEDTLICEFGARMLQYHKDHHMKTVISQKMRELARLKCEMKAKVTLVPSMDRSLNQLEDFLHPDLYKQLVSCVHKIAGYDEETGQFKTPSLAKKLGYSLQTCAELMECKGLMMSNEELRKRAENFSKLLTKMWKTDVSINASKTLSVKSWNKPKILPLAEDIKRLHDFLGTREKSVFEQLLHCPSELPWRELAEISLVKIILLNRRRSGEAQRIELSQYRTIDNQPVNSDTTELLSDIEKKLCKSFSRFHIRGKASGRTGRPVTVLLTNTMRQSIDLLINTREKANINPKNPYLFAIPRTTNSCIRGSDVLRQYAKLANVKRPEGIKSINLRKQVATMSQLLNLNENDIESLATFMGHSLNVHKEYYRLPDDVLQMAKISKLLLALESGKIKELKGQNFDNLAISDCDTEEDDEELNSAEVLKNKPKLVRSPITKDNEPSTSTTNTTIVTEMSFLPDNNSEDGEEISETISKSISKIAKKKRRATSVKRPWSEKEKAAILKHFMKHLISKKVPNKEECVKCIEEEACLSERSWAHVKFQVKNMFNKF